MMAVAVAVAVATDAARGVPFQIDSLALLCTAL